MSSPAKLRLFALGVLVGTVLTIIGSVNGLVPLLFVGPILLLLVPILSACDKAHSRRQQKRMEKAWYATPVTMPIIPAPPLEDEDDDEEEREITEDVVDWLRSLGYRARDAKEAVQHMGSGPLDERVKRALQWLGQR